jgi:hypothetical protein
MTGITISRRRPREVTRVAVLRLATPAGVQGATEAPKDGRHRLESPNHLTEKRD